MKLATVLVLAAAALTACGGGAVTTTPAANDPRAGWVRIDGPDLGSGNQAVIWKRCDGRTLLYVSHAPGFKEGGISAVNPSTECAP